VGNPGGQKTEGGQFFIVEHLALQEFRLSDISYLDNDRIPLARFTEDRIDGDPFQFPCIVESLSLKSDSPPVN